MSERQAKKNRKELSEIKAEVKQTNPKKVISNIVIAAVIAAVAALGAYATWDKIAPSLTTSNEQTQAESQTIAEFAESQGTTVEELLQKCGMTELGLTGESDITEMQSKFTIESYAKFLDMTAEDLKAENGIEDLANNTNWQEAAMKIPMSKVAEQTGMSFEEFAKQNELPAEITAEMTQEEAMNILQTQMMMEQATVETTDNTDSAEAENE